MNRTQSIALVRALAAVSWADGRLDRAEESHLKSLAYRLGLGAEDLGRELQPLLDQPVAYDRAMELVGDLVKLLGSAGDRELFLGELRRLVEADGEVSDEERSVLAEVDAALAGYGAVDFMIGKLRGAFTSLVARPRRQRPPARELLPYVKNKVLGRLLERLRSEGIEATLPAARLNRAALEGALLARVAVAADQEVDDAELDTIRNVLETRGGLEGAELEVALAVLREGADAGMDRQRLCSEFNRVSTLDERKQLVADLFAVAGDAPAAETLTEIRLLANFLWIPTREFADIRAQFGRRDAPTA